MDKVEKFKELLEKLFENIEMHNSEGDNLFFDNAIEIKKELLKLYEEAINEQETKPL